jgi:large subunit ribosomal protein L24
VEKPLPVQASNVMIFCDSCKKGARIGHKEVKGKKIRVCVKCGKEF